MRGVLVDCDGLEEVALDGETVCWIEIDEIATRARGILVSCRSGALGRLVFVSMVGCAAMEWRGGMKGCEEVKTW